MLEGGCFHEGVRLHAGVYEASTDDQILPPADGGGTVAAGDGGIVSFLVEQKRNERNNRSTHRQSLPTSPFRQWIFSYYVARTFFDDSPPLAERTNLGARWWERAVPEAEETEDTPIVGKTRDGRSLVQEGAESTRGRPGGSVGVQSSHGPGTEASVTIYAEDYGADENEDGRLLPPLSKEAKK